jgi:hypothetical protein
VFLFILSFFFYKIREQDGRTVWGWVFGTGERGEVVGKAIGG